MAFLRWNIDVTSCDFIPLLYFRYATSVTIVFFRHANLPYGDISFYWETLLVSCDSNPGKVLIQFKPFVRQAWVIPRYEVQELTWADIDKTLLLLHVKPQKCSVDSTVLFRKVIEFRLLRVFYIVSRWRKGVSYYLKFIMALYNTDMRLIEIGSIFLCVKQTK